MSEQLLQELHLENQQAPVISVVGAGGKTSVICELAKEYQKAEESAVVMTTTHMRRPAVTACFIEAEASETSEAKLLEFERQLKKAVQENKIIWVGSLSKEHKIGSMHEDYFKKILEQQVPVLIEADGAKCLPLKAPESHEPVIAQQTTTVISVYGLDAVGQTIGTCTHRPQQVMNVLKKSLGDAVTEEDIAKLALCSEGGKKGVAPNMDYQIVLNKADTNERMKSAEKIKAYLKQNTFDTNKMHVTSFRKHEAVLVLAAGMGKRFGDNKLLKEYEGKPIYQYMIDNLEQIRECQQVIVTRTLEIETRANVAGITTVHNDHPELGISHSLGLGLSKCLKEDPLLKRVVVCVCDQPNLKAETISRLLETGRAQNGKIICASVEQKARNPVLWDRRYFQELLAIKGDIGGRQVIEKHQGDVILVEIGENEVRDIDYPQDITKIGRR